MKHYQLLLLFTIACLFYACAEKKHACKYGQPEPIFSTDLKKVDKHQFERQGQQATETIAFENGLRLEILQSGCDEIRQEFRVGLPGNFKDKGDDYFKEMAVQTFHYLSGVSGDHFGLYHLGKAIEDRFHDIKLGQPVELEKNYFLKIDKILNDMEILLLIELRSNM